ncbi:hypothetical protein EG68_08024 [Paragonimus skrjabini miyazakii]|uniref:G-protein coupled receptors family 1 profile domain-containing protein n=1 Tax=Paragonimus skrjabini miyazakii TaxID=59628 RepID=A0A8S9YR32_9TREM|nr:hypothetical protein EG68_08024 [Paragonimus skrjabini miyazakii]
MGFPIKTLAAFNQFWGWGKRACELYGFAGGFLGFVSLTTLTFIALDRYLAVIHPFENQPRLQSGHRVSKFLLFIWLWALTWSIPPFFGYGSYRLEGFHTSCTFDYLSTDVLNVLFNAGMYIFAFLLPFGLLTFCYYGIVHKLQTNKRSLRSLSSQRTMDRLRAIRRHQEIRVVRISAILVLLYLMAWCPYAMICLLALIGKRSHLTPVVAELPVVFAKTSPVYNPIVYALMHENFRTELIKYPAFKWLCFCLPKKRSVSVGTTVLLTSSQQASSSTSTTQELLVNRRSEQF